jgi:hypothetical protein
MRTRWTATGQAKQVTAPVSLIVTAFATLDDVRGTLTPQLQPGDTTLVLVDLGQGRSAWAARCWRRCWASSATGARPRRPAQLKALVAASTSCARRAAAGLPRPQRRRPVGGGLRDGLRRPPGREPERRHPGHRRRRHRRQPRRVRRLQELGHAGRRAPQRADAAGAVQRGAGRRAAGAHRRAQRGDGHAARARPEPARARHRQAQRPRRGRGLARCQGCSSARRCATCSRPGTRSAGASRGCATTRPAPTAEHAAAGAPTTPACTCT